MKFEEFWDSLSDGGKTLEGNEYNIVDDGKLHIRSPGNVNSKHHIRKDTVKRYFEKDIPMMGEKKFRYWRSSYFYNIYQHIVKRYSTEN